MARIGKTIDELDGFSGNPSLGSLIAVRDMTLAASDENATKKFSIGDLIDLVHSYREHLIAQATLPALTPTLVTFPDAFASTPEVGIIRVTQGGLPVGVGVDITNITNEGFTATALEACVLTYIAGKVTA